MGIEELSIGESERLFKKTCKEIISVFEQHPELMKKEVNGKIILCESKNKKRIERFKVVLGNYLKQHNYENIEILISRNLETDKGYKICVDKFLETIYSQPDF